MKKIIRILSCVAWSLFISCEPALKVTSDYDKSIDFTKYKTFAILNLHDKDQAVSQLNANRIMNAIKSEMIKKGFKEEVDMPDLKVHAITIMTQKSELSSSNTDYYGYGGVYRPYGWGAGNTGYTTYNVRDFTDGSLIIEVIDATSDKLIWEGVGNKEIDSPSKDPDKTIPEAIAKIMKAFPPVKK